VFAAGASGIPSPLVSTVQLPVGVPTTFPCSEGQTAAPVFFIVISSGLPSVPVVVVSPTLNEPGILALTYEALYEVAPAIISITKPSVEALFHLSKASLLHPPDVNPGVPTASSYGFQQAGFTAVTSSTGTLKSYSRGKRVSETLSKTAPAGSGRVCAPMKISPRRL
jgi:hypothetical protein